MPIRSALPDAGLLEEIPGEVLTDQLIVGHVRIESANQVVAILPRIRDVRITLAAVGVRVADPVHPVAGPALAEVGRVQVVIHHLFVGLRIRISEKLIDLLRARRQSHQRKTQPANQGGAVGRGGRLQPCLRQARLGEAVHPVGRPPSGSAGFSIA